MSHRGHDPPEFCGRHPAMHKRHSHRRCKGEVRTCEGKAASAAAGCAIRSPWRCSTLSAAIACHPACRTICCRRSGSRARSELLDFVGHETWAGAHSSSASKAILEGAGQGAHDAAPPRACAAPIWPPRRPPSPSATVVRFPEFLHFTPYQRGRNLGISVDLCIARTSVPPSDASVHAGPM